MKDRVLYIVSGDLWGGAEAQVLLQTQALKALGWQVHVLLFNEGETFSRYAAAGLDCHLLRETPGIPVFSRKLVNRIRQIAPDIIAAHGYKESFAAFAASLCCRIPWISTFHGLSENYTGFAAFKSRFYMAMYLHLSRIHASRIIAVSSSLARQLGIEHLRKLVIITNVAQCAADASAPTVFGGRPAIAFVGRLAPVKRADLALQAFAILLRQREDEGKEKPHLYVIGDGPERPKLSVLANSPPLAGCVHFLGFRNDAASLIGQADALLISSDSEGIPTVLLEAIAAVTPVASTDVGGISDVLAGLPGYPSALAPRGDAPQLAIALARVIEMRLNESEKTAIRTAFADHFSPATAAQKLDAMYREILAKSTNKEITPCTKA
ncbi:MAG TPA: glycosyltransferase [Oligoflexia bacterium]|nr:glycosyltransferase [Oligoflexia bacterium]